MDENLKTLEIMKKRFYQNLDNPDHAKNYAEVIHDCLYEDLIELDEAKQEFRFIQDQFPRLYRIRNFIAETLTPWEHQDISEVAETLELLENYYHRNPENETLAESYAISLWLYYCHPQAENRSSTLNTLSELLNAFPDNEVINEKYYDALAQQADNNPEIEKVPLKKKAIVHGPKPVRKENDAEQYAYSLLDFANRQNSLEESFRTYEKLDSLSKKYPKNDYIKECCAKALYDILPYIDDAAIPELLEDLRVYQTNSSSEEVARIYALCLEDSPKINMGIIEELKRIYEQYPLNKSIIDSYGYILSSFAKDTNFSQTRRSEARTILRELRSTHPEIDTLTDYLDS